MDDSAAGPNFNQSDLIIISPDPKLILDIAGLIAKTWI